MIFHLLMLAGFALLFIGLFVLALASAVDQQPLIYH